MKVIGLTGGIGTGKSTVSEYLQQKGCFIIDADRISRQMTESGSPALEELRDAFGDEYFKEDGSLDRARLAALVFAHEDKRRKLEDIITRRVVETIREMVLTCKTKTPEKLVIIDAPLLFECGLDACADENWLVCAPLEARLKRVEKRDHLPREQILARIKSQMPEDEARRRCSLVLDNSAGRSELLAQIDRELERIRNEIR